MRLFSRILTLGGCVAAALGWSMTAGAQSQLLLSETFGDNPVDNGRAEIVNDSSPSRWTFNAGSVVGHYDTSQTSSILKLDLGKTLTDADSFAYRTTFRVLSSNYFPDNTGGNAQISFGLFNSVTTGLNRSGTDAAAANSYDVMSVDYFPTDNPFFDTVTITPTTITSPVSSNSSDGLLFPAAKESVITESGEVAESTRALPLDTDLTVHLVYSGNTRTITVTLGTSAGLLNINNVGDGGPGGHDGDIFTIQHTLPQAGDPVSSYFGAPPDPRDLDGNGLWDFTPELALDSFGLFLWEDGYDKQWSGAGVSSLIADVQFSNIQVWQVPEPASALALAGLGVVLLKRRRVAH